MACKTGKKRYRDELGANIALSNIVGGAKHHRKQRQDKLPIRSYKCPLCGGHHLTSQAKGEQE